MLIKQKIIEDMLKIFRESEENTVPAEKALEGCAGLVFFDEPVFGVSSATDKLYEQYRQPEVIGSTFMTPREWLKDAHSVISFFLPFTERVRSSNRGEPKTISPEWLHARVEGHQFLDDYTEKLMKYFTEQGVECCVPAIDERFRYIGTPLAEGDPEGIHFESSWSERHAAYAGGLGTFCLSRGLISPKGVAGRYGSIIISDYVEPDSRPYTGIYDYCIRCGSCINRCPVKAISLEHGKNQLRCDRWVKAMGVLHAPRYGCGKCQVGVPCESRIPNAAGDA